MQFVEGVELSALIAESDGLSVREAYAIAIQLADGLQAIHDEGIVHRDFKSANVMIDRRGDPRLMDFGIAKLWNTEPGLTTDGQIAGTPAYMSPERRPASRSIRARTCTRWVSCCSSCSPAGGRSRPTASRR